MLYLKSFCFNPFQENTYLLYDDKADAIIIDPGNSTSSENKLLSDFITDKKLRLNRLILTHAHIDHILGNRYILDTYGLLPEIHANDVYFIERMEQSAMRFGVRFDQSPMPEKFLEEGQIVSLGNYDFKCIFTPGHSPGSISFYNEETRLLIGGDVLFRESIGRTDLPMGNHETLLRSIKEKIFALPDDVKVYSGHGPATSVGHEKSNNPFIV